jgi:hypothetical protein
MNLATMGSVHLMSDLPEASWIDVLADMGDDQDYVVGTRESNAWPEIIEVLRSLDDLHESPHPLNWPCGICVALNNLKRKVLGE